MLNLADLGALLVVAFSGLAAALAAAAGHRSGLLIVVCGCGGIVAGYSLALLHLRLARALVRERPLFYMVSSLTAIVGAPVFVFLTTHAIVR
jgi:hypothetical protein